MPIAVITLGLPFLGPDAFGELYGPCWCQWLDMALSIIWKYCLIWYSESVILKINLLGFVIFYKIS